MDTTKDPIVLAPGEGRTFPSGARTMTVKVEAPQAPFALFESRPEPGVPTAPPHRHRDLAEAFYVLEGVMEFRAGERVVRGQAGTFVYIPAGVVHGFRNPGPGPATMLVLVTPAQGLGLIEEMGAVLSAGGALDAATAQAIFARYHTELV